MTGLRTFHADVSQAEPIHALLAAAGQHLARQGFTNWEPPYPLEQLLADLRDREVYSVRRGDDHLAATYTLATEPVRPYVPEPWSVPGPTALYLNRLAVDPGLQGRGVGGWCLAQAAARGRVVGAVAIRCDVLQANAALCAFYERHGYACRGERRHSGWTFSCYEYLLGS